MLAGTADIFEKADSRNLPKVSNVMVVEYIVSSSKHNIGEIRGAKILLSSRDSYLNSAVGYVQVQRKDGNCLVKAKIVPEHKVGSKMYQCTAAIDETNETVTDSSCADCAAAQGGCKHSLLLLFWLAKKSQEPSSTETECYWIKPQLSYARTAHIESKDIFPRAKKPKIDLKNPTVLQEFMAECTERRTKDSLLQCIDEHSDSKNLFDMALQFVEDEKNDDYENFRQYVDAKINQTVIEEVKSKTVDQASSRYWNVIRQGRLTASKLYEAARCKTDGALVEQILGGYKVPETVAIKRGKALESRVVEEIEKKVKKRIEKCGFVLINGILGASPDGVGEDFVVEIKCPTTCKTMLNYVENGNIKDKHRTQLYCQMLACRKDRGIFCVADPTFEVTKKVHIYWLDFDKTFIENIIKHAENFWKKFVFPKLIQSAKK